MPFASKLPAGREPGVNLVEAEPGVAKTAFDFLNPLSTSIVFGLKSGKAQAGDRSALPALTVERKAVASRIESIVPCVTLSASNRKIVSNKTYPHMLFSREYVGYLAREATKKLIAGKFIETAAVAAVTGRVNAALVDELSLEDRINDEVRVILEAYSEEMRNSGANYQEMFRKVKSELVRKYKAVL